MSLRMMVLSCSRTGFEIAIAIMSDANRRDHWENIYATKGENEVSWFEENPAPSLELIGLARLTPDSTIVDIGGGASRLVDSLIARGFRHVAHCVEHAIASGDKADQRRKIAELMAVVGRAER